MLNPRYFHATTSRREGRRNGLSWNAYTYVFNNPLTLTDPTGMFSWRGFLRTFGQVLNIVAIFVPQLQVFAQIFNGIMAYANGGLKGGLLNAFTSMIPGLNSVPGIWDNIGNLAISAAVGGASATVMGGRFKEGAIGSLKSAAISMTLGAIAQGARSRQTGAKFASGADTKAAMGAVSSPQEQARAAGSIQPGIPSSDVTDARLALDVYGETPVGADGYTPAGELFTSPSGFAAQLYTNGADQVVAFRGTEISSWANWKSNLRQAFGYRSAQYEEAMALASEMTAYYPSIRFTGHSLGGGLAAAAAISTGRTATTFNAAGLHSNTTRGYKFSESSIRAYNSRWDVLRAGNAFSPANMAGQRISLGNAGTHGMVGVCKAMGC